MGASIEARPGRAIPSMGREAVVEQRGLRLSGGLECATMRGTGSMQEIQSRRGVRVIKAMQSTRKDGVYGIWDTRFCGNDDKYGIDAVFC